MSFGENCIMKSIMIDIPSQTIFGGELEGWGMYGRD